MVKISGAQRFTDRLQRMASNSTTSAADKALYVAGTLIEIEAENSITAGSISGPNHVPSNPYEPPNADTRALDGSIHTVVVGRGRVNVEAGEGIDYAAALEFGTSKMLPRPYLGPASKKKSPEAVRLIAEAMRRARK